MTEKKLKKLHGQELMRAIVLSPFLPGPPKMFRRQQVMLALEQEGYYCVEGTLNPILTRLVQHGYLEHAADKSDEGFHHRFHWYRFKSKKRVSVRPGFRPGERHDLFRSDDDGS